jgi:hypothetical protein
MHFAQTRHDPLAHLSDLPYYDTSTLGQWQAAAAAMAMEALKKKGNSSGGATGTGTPGGTGMPGDEPSVPRQPSAAATVAASFQTSISPQISPVMTQQMASPGASVGANPMQYMPGGMGAETGMSPYGNFAAPGMPGAVPGISPMQPYTIDPNTGRYVPLGPGPGQSDPSGMYTGTQGSPVSVGGGQGMTEIPWIPIAIIGAGVGLALFLGKKKKRTH